MHRSQKNTHTGNRPPPPPVPAPAGRGEVILVVDDEPRIRDAARRALTKQGYQIIAAADGVEAVALFASQQEKIKLILTDIMMPHMDGIEMIRRIRKLDPHVKVIAASGMVSASDSHKRLDELAALGVKIFLDKPFSIEQLLEAIRVSLDAQGPA
jgi:two-component system cell cycle sensor histidine kinase/response regulator CckA